MRLKAELGSRGFTLIEVAIAMGILGVLTIVIAALFIRTLDTYGQVASDTDASKQARACLDRIAREMRESVSAVPVNPAEGAGLTPVQNDALLLTSARISDGVFSLDGSNFPSPQSIILFYINTTPERITQLVRLQLYYVEDLSAYVAPYGWATPAYSGNNIVIHDNNGALIQIDRATGAVAGTPPNKAPEILMNRATSFDIVDNGANFPIIIKSTCQIMDRFGRAASARLETEISVRNM